MTSQTVTYFAGDELAAIAQEQDSQPTKVQLPDMQKKPTVFKTNYDRSHAGRPHIVL